MSQNDLDDAIATLKELLDGNNDSYPVLVELAEKEGYTLSCFDRLVRILETVADRM